MNVFYTSANVDSDIFKVINDFSKRYDFSKSHIVMLLIKMAIGSFENKGSTHKLIEYQDHVPNEWVKLNYSMNADEVEFIEKSRFYFKISVSKLIFIGFLFFWDKVVKKLLKKGKKSLNLSSYLFLITLYKSKIENYKNKLKYHKLE